MESPLDAVSSPLANGAQNLCLLRLSAIGDVTHVVPVVRVIQDQLPKTKITWVCGKVERDVLSALTGERFVVFDKKAGWRAYRDLRRELNDERFDVLLHMQVAVRANLASACIQADVKLGWDKGRSRELHRRFVHRSIEHVARQHQVQGFLSFARALGLQADEPEWDLPVSREGVEFADRVLPGGQKTLLISPCSSHTLRNWPADRYAAVADHAVERHGMRVALTGGRSDLEASTGKAIERSMKHRTLNLIGKDTLPTSLALLQRSDVVLSPDSGPAHLADALGTPVVGLYACTRSRRSGPYRSLDLCVDRFAEASRRFLGKDPDTVRWDKRIEKPGVMELIQVDDVIERLDAAVARQE